MACALETGSIKEVTNNNWLPVNEGTTLLGLTVKLSDATFTVVVFVVE